MDRRSLLAALAAAPMAAAAGGKTGMGMWIPGGIAGITRCRVGVVGTRRQYNIPSIMLPKPHVMYLLPTDSLALAAGLFFNEAADVIVGDNAQQVIQTLGLWQLSLMVDWPGQHIASGLRKIAIWQCPAGTQPPAYTPGQLTMIPDSNPYLRLASYDAPGSAGTPNADAWNALHAPLTALQPGDSIFATVASETDGDWIQSSAMTALQCSLIMPQSTPENRRV